VPAGEKSNKTIYHTQLLFFVLHERFRPSPQTATRNIRREKQKHNLDNNFTSLDAASCSSSSLSLTLGMGGAHRTLLIAQL
jgi:hypothetical protein